MGEIGSLGASAELNAMREFFETKPGTADGANFEDGLPVEEVYLVGTSTQPGALARQVLEIVLEERFGVRVSGQGPSVLPQDGDENFVASLLHLWEKLLRYVRARQAEGRVVAINATGGLKPELAMCLVAGNLTGVPVYYRHEHYGKTVVLPTLVWPLCPSEIRDSLRALSAGVISGPNAARYDAEYNGRRLERLCLAEVYRDASGEAYRVELRPYGRLLLELAKEETGNDGFAEVGLDG